MDIFTDGSFKKLKNKTKLCGYGIHWPGGEFPDIGKPFIYPPMTNQRAELYAILKALKIVHRSRKNNININNNNITITIYTDSEYSIKCFTQWYKTWELNDWKNSNNEPVKNQDIIKPVVKYLKKNNNYIKFKHVRSHTGKQDYESLGNEKADKLALLGAGLSIN